MIPHNKEMVKSYRDKPFAFIGVNSDGDRSVVQKITKDQGLNYRNAVDGKGLGPIAKAWHVNGWPTIYIIDAAGVIRNKFLGSETKKLSEAVDALLKK